MGLIEVPGENAAEKEPAEPKSDDEKLPSHHPRDEDLIEGVACPFTSTFQVFQELPKHHETAGRITAGGKLTPGSVTVEQFPVGTVNLWGQCHRRCGVFDHENDCCSQSAKSRNAQPQEAAP